MSEFHSQGLEEYKFFFPDITAYYNFQLISPLTLQFLARLWIFFSSFKNKFRLFYFFKVIIQLQHFSLPIPSSKLSCIFSPWSLWNLKLKLVSSILASSIVMKKKRLCDYIFWAQSTCNPIWKLTGGCSSLYLQLAYIPQ